MKRFTSLRMVILLAVLIISFGYFTATTQAMQVEYRFTGSGVFGVFNDGSNDIEFNDGSFLMSFLGDTTNVNITDDSDVPFNPGLPGSLFLSAFEIGTVTRTFLDLQDVFVVHSYEFVGFGTLSLGDLLLVFAPGQGLDTYDLTSYFGPIPGNLSSTSTMDFDIGFLDIESIETATFAAAKVPEPGTMMLLGSGLFGLIGFARKRFMK